MSSRETVGTSHPSKNIMTTSRPLELLHMDLFGPVAYLSIVGSKYGLIIVDDYPRITWVFFLQNKFETQVSGTIIRGTLKTPNSQLVTPISIKLQRPDGCD
jgi:hypothetical protein